MRGQFRLVHVGVAAALAAATVTAVGLAQSVGAAGGTSSVYVPIVPCRLVDTRPAPDNIGPRATPLGAAEAVTFSVWGVNGSCTIPNTATGIATNVTAVHPTADSYVTVYPADANPRPTASNLNVVAGGAPTPNQVTVGLSATGAIAAYNNGGTLDLVIDIVGYYLAAPSGGLVNNDDRYYTKAQIDTTIAVTNAVVATKQDTPTGTRNLLVSPVGFIPGNDLATYTVGGDQLSPTNTVCFYAPVSFPNGARITQLTIDAADNSASASVTGTFSRETGAPTDHGTLVAEIVSTTTGGTPGNVSLHSAGTAAAVIDDQNYTYNIQFCGGSGIKLYEAIVTYTLP
ncbi:MAG: hypothetical protein JWM34_3923 [Ilumatobacteraceae bacterium]|nr:hypothetical protein [Ilumatobacteraceae bacterium]